MLAQVVTLGSHANGTLQQSLLLARALAALSFDVRLVSLTPDIHPSVIEAGRDVRLGLVAATPDEVPPAHLSIVVGLWDAPSVAAAAALARGPGRLILAPTLYRQQSLLSGFSGRAEALWFVSWDQAVAARDSWHLAGRVEVVRCVVDTERFRPSGRVPTGDPWVVCRHSFDDPSKFAPDTEFIVRGVAQEHDVVFEMLGAARSLATTEGGRLRAYPQEAFDPALFLRRGDLWVYAHAPQWRETACVAMLEAMACGLPVVVNNLGGMREYVAHGRTGFACNSSREFVEFTCLLLDRPSLRAAMAAEARAFVERRHSLASLVPRLRELLGA
ncbi:MAG TPA: glycosyltransferase [Pyrinomonadaceae bacterium]|jgi:glycosyltransferase involved in cell wall biosynthesis|nr:glycosyltransferase [Pyrinomonadaceae bacterium]